jgi:glycosyltransferase involved in cell wall biosynthesis
MKLSIIIPYYNGERWISKCLNSLLHQDLTNDEYEIIIVDDGSTDNTQIVKDFVLSYKNIYYFRQENKGISAARNKGLTIAKGDYVFFCDCDDYVTENVLGRLYNIAISYDLNVLFFNYRVIKEDDVQPQPCLKFDDVTIYDPGINLMLSPPYKTTSTAWSFLIKRDFIEKRPLVFNEEQKFGEDYYYYLDMMRDVGRIGTVNAEIYYWVMHSKSITHSSGKDLIKRYDGFVNGLFQHLSHLIDFRNYLTAHYKVPVQVLEELDNSKDSEVFNILILYFRYYSFKENVLMTRKMNALGVYPIQHKYLKETNHNYRKQFILRKIGELMNIRPLWLSACALFHCLPKKVRDLC